MYMNEIFTSLSGEADGFGNQGGLVTFVRLQGCNLNCSWCDTRYAQCPNNGEEMSIKEVAKKCVHRHIIITGGEPLLQQSEVAQLVDVLVANFAEKGIHDKRKLVTIETNGSILIAIDATRTWYNFLRFVVDYKLDSSCMTSHMQPSIFERLCHLDVIKFVVANLQDYKQAKELVQNSNWHAKKVFSPTPGWNWPETLATLMIQDKLEDVTFSLQWHKMLKIK